MTVLELQTKKVELARNILSLDDEEIINRLAKLYNNLTMNFPCQYTEEEILQSCEEAIKEYKEGKGTPHERIKKKIE